VLVEQASQDRSASDPLAVKVRSGLVGAWREKPQRSMRPPPDNEGEEAGTNSGITAGIGDEAATAWTRRDLSATRAP